MNGLLLALALVASPDTLELTLSDALRLAFRQSPARTQVKVSRAQAATTVARGLSGLVPSVSGAIGAGQTGADGAYSPWQWTGSVTLSQVVFDPAVFAGVAASFARAGSYSAEAQDRQARLIYDVTSEYLSILRARMLYEAAAAALVRAEENLRLVGEQERLGAAAVIDEMRAEVLHSQAEIELIRAEKALAVTQENFKAAVGLESGVAIRPVEALDDSTPGAAYPPDRLLEEIRRRNPGLKTAARAEKAASIATWGAAARALPSVSAYWTSTYADTLFPRSIGRWQERDQISRGVQLSFPLLDLKSYALSLAEAANESRRARAASAAARLAINSTATAAVLSYTEALKTREYAARNLDLNRELFDLARRRYELGALPLADLAAVEAGLSQAQATHIAALCDVHIQAALINYLLGRTDPSAKEER